MSLVNSFTASLPLTPKKLIAWLRIILENIDNVRIDSSAIDSIESLNRGANISNIISSTVFDEIHDAIVNGKRVEISGTNIFKNVLSATTFDMVSDDFYSFQIIYVTNDAQLVELSISKMMGTMYLDNKTTTALTT